MVTSVANAYCSVCVLLKVTNKRRKQLISMATTTIMCMWLPQERQPLSHYTPIQPEWPSNQSQNFMVTSVASAYCSVWVLLKVTNEWHKQSISMATTTIISMWLPQVRTPLSHHPAIYPEWPSCLSWNVEVTSVPSAYSTVSSSLKVTNKWRKPLVSMATTTTMHM